MNKNSTKRGKSMKMKYGTIVTLFPIINANPELFIPKCFEWENESTKAIVRIDKYEIKCNLGTKLLFYTDEGIREIKIPFVKKEMGYRCNLLRLFRDEGIPYTEGTGIYCDGAAFTQKDSSSEALYCKKAIIEHCHSPYWGEQYELRIVDQAYSLEIGGNKVKILRFNECDLGQQNKIEDWLSSLIEENRKLDAYELEKRVRKFVKGGAFTCSLYYQKSDGSYDWTYYK